MRTAGAPAQFKNCLIIRIVICPQRRKAYKLGEKDLSARRILDFLGYCNGLVPGAERFNVHNIRIGAQRAHLYHRPADFNLPAFSGSNAVKTGRVYVLPSDFDLSEHWAFVYPEE